MHNPSSIFKWVFGGKMQMSVRKSFPIKLIKYNAFKLAILTCKRLYLYSAVDVAQNVVRQFFLTPKKSFLTFIVVKTLLYCGLEKIQLSFDMKFFGRWTRCHKL